LCGEIGIKDFNKRFEEFTNRFGEVVEYMPAPNMREEFKEHGFIFHQAGPDVKFADDDHGIFFEVDVLLQNGDKAMLVEVKPNSIPTTQTAMLSAPKKMCTYADLRGDKRAFLGAVAGVVMTDKTKEYALGHGFFVIEPSGENLIITPPHSKPKEW